MIVWIFSSKNLENIRIAKNNLLWGFWDKNIGKRTKRNWRDFIRLYNEIKKFDIVLFQIAKTGEIHAVGLVNDKFYDDQTPLWDLEKEKGKVLFPWRVSFSIIIFSEKPIISHFIKIENYIDGFGIGKVPIHEYKSFIEKIRKILEQVQLDINIKLD